MAENTNDEWDDLDNDPDASARAERQVQAAADLLPSPRQPLAVARVLVDSQYQHSDGLVLRFWRGAFWGWRRSHWLEAEEAELRSSIYSLTEHASYRNDKDKLQLWAPNRYKIADVLDALRAVTHLPELVDQPGWLDTQPGESPSARSGTRANPLWPPAPPGEIVACSNGLLHVTTRELYGHTPTFFNRVAVPFPYDPADPPPIPARWLAFLAQLWPDDPASIEALQEWFGYCVSGRVDLHKILLLIGPTRAGKGVIARVLGALLGRGNVAGPTLASLGQNFGLQDLIGKPVAVIADARLGGASTHQVVERLLSISGEDMLTIDRKYREPWTGKLPTRFMVISNELPRFGDASGAIARRFVVLACQQSWLGRENPQLTEELLIELPGILGWALDGAERLQRTGHFTEPSSSSDAITTLLDTVSPTSAFVRDRCTAGAGCECSVDELYAAWRSWCEDNGMDRPGTKQTFGRNLRAVLPALAVSQPREGASRERRYVGITLTETHNGGDRVPPRATAPESTPARSGTRANPLRSPTPNGADPTGDAHCDRCGRPTDYTVRHPATGDRWCPACCRDAGVQA